MSSRHVLQSHIIADFSRLPCFVNYLIFKLHTVGSQLLSEHVGVQLSEKPDKTNRLVCPLDFG